jgi:LmbE family N-acetylglucosaminyl deacetylase
VVSTTIAGDGTAESAWAPWLAAQTWPQLDLDSVAGRRIVVLAAHPDDEVLGAAGLMTTLARAGHDIVIVWATDGERSHPGSTAISDPDLRRTRRAESRAALARLGITPTAVHWLGLPDSAVASRRELLEVALRRIVVADDAVIAPWSEDGHPDHDALGAAAQAVGSLTWLYPIWMWHWAEPGDERVPWHRFRATDVSDLAAKRCAVSLFRSQVEPIGPRVADAAVLSPATLARLIRSREWIIT